jgi:hypothetical protein
MIEPHLRKGCIAYARRTTIKTQTSLSLCSNQKQRERFSEHRHMVQLLAARALCVGRTCIYGSAHQVGGSFQSAPFDVCAFARCCKASLGSFQTDNSHCGVL